MEMMRFISFWGCCNNISQSRWLKIMEMYSFPGLEAEERTEGVAE
jgi:hypothetical protein